MSKLTQTQRAFVFLSMFMALCMPGLARADGSCSADAAIKICVVSAALIVDNTYPWALTAEASVDLQITDMTDYPVEMAAVADNSAWSFTPKNAATMTGWARFSGIAQCGRDFSGTVNCNGEYTTFPPRVPIDVQVRIAGIGVPKNGIPLVQMATKASLAGTLSLVERGNARLLPLPIQEFEFGNGLASLRNY